MTYPTLPKSSSLAFAAGCAALLGVATGCGSDDEPVVQQPRPKPVVVEPVIEEPVDLGPTLVADLMAEFDIDSRISMSEDAAPDNDEIGRAHV